MKILLINQAFHPDVVSSGQHLADFAAGLAQKGHEVTVICSRRAYDDPAKVFIREEHWRGVRIYRVFNTGFGKGAKWRRAADFLSFLWSCSWRLLLSGRPDVVVALTSPPLVSVIAAVFAGFHRAKFCYWIMDLNPDEAIAAGWLSPSSLAARWLERLSRFSLDQASLIVVLDEFMRQRILGKGIAPGKIAVIAPWSHDSEVRYDEPGRAAFQSTYGLDGKFVVMYAGNHSPCHPLDTFLGAVKTLSNDPQLAFVFVGGGTGFAKVKAFVLENKLSNVTCLPYQPLDHLSRTLSGADLHLVVMGDPFVGLVHPCKTYNLLRVNAPIIYIGPKHSHISEILDRLGDRLPNGRAAHGDSGQVAQCILALKNKITKTDRTDLTLGAPYSLELLLPQLINRVESLAVNERAITHPAQPPSDENCVNKPEPTSQTSP